MEKFQNDPFFEINHPTVYQDGVTPMSAYDLKEGQMFSLEIAERRTLLLPYRQEISWPIMQQIRESSQAQSEHINLRLISLENTVEKIEETLIAMATSINKIHTIIEEDKEPKTQFRQGTLTGFTDVIKAISESTQAITDGLEEVSQAIEEEDTEDLESAIESLNDNIVTQGHETVQTLLSIAEASTLFAYSIQPRVDPAKIIVNGKSYPFQWMATSVLISAYPQDALYYEDETAATNPIQQQYKTAPGSKIFLTYGMTPLDLVRYSILTQSQTDLPVGHGLRHYLINQEIPESGSIQYDEGQVTYEGEDIGVYCIKMPDTEGQSATQFRVACFVDGHPNHINLDRSLYSFKGYTQGITERSYKGCLSWPIWGNGAGKCQRAFQPKTGITILDQILAHNHLGLNRYDDTHVKIPDIPSGGYKKLTWQEANLIFNLDGTAIFCVTPPQKLQTKGTRT